MTIRRSLIFLLLFLASPPVQGQMIANVFERILLVRVGGNGPGAEAGTAFTLDVDGRQYLLTAKHVAATRRKRFYRVCQRGEMGPSVGANL